jgi:superoxide dismutase, Fe-Mn family
LGVPWTDQKPEFELCAKSRTKVDMLRGFPNQKPKTRTQDRKDKEMAFTLPPLPWAKDALAPHISAETIDFHYGKHHQTYVDNLNKLIQGKPEESKSLEEIIQAAELNGPAFNNAAQVWNHTFYWSSMKPGGGGRPTGKLLEAINRDLGSVDNLLQQLGEAAKTQFGSGWAWLVEDGGKLKVIKTPNAELPMRRNQKALLTCDVWEHAYYIDYRNARPKYVEAFLQNLVNWDFAAKNLG